MKKKHSIRNKKGGSRRLSKMLGKDTKTDDKRILLDYISRKTFNRY